MRVLLVSGSYPPLKCGVGDYCYFLANALAKNQSNVIGVLTSVLDINAVAPSRVNFYPVMKNWNLRSIFQYIKILLDFKPSIVHIQYPTQGYKRGNLPWFLPAVAWFLRKRVVQTWHEGYARKNAIQLAFKGIIPGDLIYVKPEYRKKFHPKFMRWVFWNKREFFIKNASVIPSNTLNEEQRAQTRLAYLEGQKRLIVFFGFIHSGKNVELLFSIANPETDIICIAGEFNVNDTYHQKIFKLANQDKWINKVRFEGFLDEQKAARLLAAADAIILPFSTGGGVWNTSLQAASNQGSFVITTAKNPTGYDKASNVYYSNINDIDEMRQALDRWQGSKISPENNIIHEWELIAKEHNNVYASLDLPTKFGLS